MRVPSRQPVELRSTREKNFRALAADTAVPELRSLTLHGLRATAVINLRRAGLTFAQIGDIVGMGAKMVEHYCRNADMRSNSRAALTHLERAMSKLITDYFQQAAGNR